MPVETAVKRRVLKPGSQEIRLCRLHVGALPRELLPEAFEGKVRETRDRFFGRS
jgi:hypothetical protein